ncbi:MAG: hypothetical protein MJ066_05470 [Clostridia bacterium]|nr:hypothetical protein [Clostridia bacterium]
MMYGNVTETNPEPLLFSLEELEKCDTRPKPPEPPKPKLKYFPNPENDNALLFNLQKEYIETGDEAKYWELWQLTAKVAERIIRKIVIRRALVWADDEINDKVSDTCLYLLRRYKTRKNYYIKDNFIIAIKDSIRHALDYQNSIDKATFYIDNLVTIENEINGGNYGLL